MCRVEGFRARLHPKTLNFKNLPPNPKTAPQAMSALFGLFAGEKGNRPKHPTLENFKPKAFEKPETLNPKP